MLTPQEKESSKMFMKKMAHADGLELLRNWGWINQTLISVHPPRHVSLRRVRNVAHNRSDSNDLAMVFVYDTDLQKIIGSFYVEYVNVIPDGYDSIHDDFVGSEGTSLKVQEIHDKLESSAGRYFYWYDEQAPDPMKPYLKFTYGKWAMLPEM